MAEPALDLERFTVGYNDGVVLSHLTLTVEVGGSLAVLGRNGVGKSTLMLAIAGHLRPKSGAIRLFGRDVASTSPAGRCRLGVGWTPQGREIFAPLTVEENLKIAATRGPWSLRRVYELFPRLEERKRNYGDQLSGGEQQMLAIGRALITNPRLLLLDEPLEGLAPTIAQDVARCIARVVSETSMTTVIIEQDVGFALKLTRETIILERGVIVRRGASQDIANDSAGLHQFIGLRKSGKPSPR